MVQPNFFIVGAPKCGTTALSVYLRNYSKVFVSYPKEPHFFCTDFPGLRSIKTKKEYQQLFNAATNEHSAVGEASVWYLYSKVAVKQIYDFNPEAKLIVMLRNPVDLVYSMHGQGLNSVDEEETEFKKAWRLQDDRLKGINLPKHCREPAKLQYRYFGKLGEQLAAVYKVFPKSQVKVIFFEDFSNDTEQVFFDVLDFLNVPSTAEEITFEIINKNAIDRFRFLAVFYKRPPKVLVNFFMWFKKLLGIKKLGVLKKLKGFNLKTQGRQELDDEFKQELVEYFSSDVRKLEELTGRDLFKWRT